MTISRFLTWVMIRIIAAVSVGYGAWVAVTDVYSGPNPAFALRVEPQERLAASCINPGYGE